MPITSVGQGLGQGTARVACHCFTLTPLGGLKCLHHLCVWYMDWHPWLGSPGLWAKVPTRSLSLYSDLLTAWWSQGGQTSYMATQGSKRESPSEQDRSCMAFYDLASKINCHFCFTLLAEAVTSLPRFKGRALQPTSQREACQRNNGRLKKICNIGF